MSPEESIRAGRETLIVYHDFPIDQEHIELTQKQGLGKDDYALPWELSGRIGTYVNELSKDEETFKKQLENFSTVNAFLRSKIRSGELKDYLKS